MLTHDHRTVYIFFGGMVQVIGAVGEWILGNTFSCALFFTYGTFWIVQGTTLIPDFGTGSQYSPTGNTLEGMKTAGYSATIGSWHFSSFDLFLTDSARPLLRYTFHYHLCLPDLLHSHQRRSLPCLVSARHRIRSVCGYVLSDCSRRYSPGSDTADGELSHFQCFVGMVC